MQKMQCRACEGLLCLDFESNVATCDYCGMEYDKRGVEISVQGVHGLDTLSKNATTFFELGELQKAKVIFTEISEKYPDSTKGWWGLLRCETNDFAPEYDYSRTHYDRAFKFATSSERVKMQEIFDIYLTRRKIIAEKQNFETGKRAEEVRARYAAEQSLEKAEKELIQAMQSGQGIGGGLLGVSVVIIIIMMILPGQSDLVVIPFFGIIIAVFIMVLNKNKKSKEVSEIQKRIEKLQNNVDELK